MLLNCGVGEDSWESFGQQGDPTSQSNVNPPWILIGRTNAECPILWLPDAKTWLIRKVPDAGKDRRQEEKEMTENKIVEWHHRHNGHEFYQALGHGDGQGSLVCCSPWYHKELDTTKWLNININILLIPWNCILSLTLNLFSSAFILMTMTILFISFYKISQVFFIKRK